ASRDPMKPVPPVISTRMTALASADPAVRSSRSECRKGRRGDVQLLLPPSCVPMKLSCHQGRRGLESRYTRVPCSAEIGTTKDDIRKGTRGFTPHRVKDLGFQGGAAWDE